MFIRFLGLELVKIKFMHLYQVVIVGIVICMYQVDFEKLNEIWTILRNSMKYGLTHGTGQ